MPCERKVALIQRKENSLILGKPESFMEGHLLLVYKVDFCKIVPSLSKAKNIQGISTSMWTYVCVQDMLGHTHNLCV